jgi:hypothetical protein
MKRERKTITPEMIRKYFGQNARITRRIADGWRVRTANGGEIKISQSNINPVYGRADVYRAAVLLANDAWGGGTVNGPPDFMLAMLAHGENESVNLRVRERGAVARAVVACLIVVIGCKVIDPVVCGVIALLVWLLMKWAAKRQAEHETDQMGFNFPRSTDAREATDEDLREGGWL